jgi:hypothetical protein
MCARVRSNELLADCKCGPGGKTGITDVSLTHTDGHAELIYTLHMVVMQVMDTPYRLEKR